MRTKAMKPYNKSFADLPHDILELISSKLSSSFFDISSFKNVCSSWRMALRYRTPKPYPVLVLLEEPEEEEKLNEISAHSIDGFMKDQREYKFKNSSWFVQQTSNHGRIFGSHPDGWVILSDEKGVVYLLHMFRKTRIELPNKFLSCNGILVEFDEEIIRKAILYATDPNKPEDFVVVMSFDRRETKLAFWRYGDCKFTGFGDRYNRGWLVLDIAFCNNIVYAIGVCPQHVHQYLESWDLKSDLGLPEKKLSTPLLGNGRDLSSLLVPFEDEIYVVSFCHWVELIQRFDSSTKGCVKVDSLNGTLFLWYGDSLIISGSDAEGLGYKANCIYFVLKEEGELKFSIYSEFDYDLDDDAKYEIVDLQFDYPRDFGFFLQST